MASRDSAAWNGQQDPLEGTAPNCLGQARSSNVAFGAGKHGDFEPDQREPVQHRALAALVKQLARQAVAETADANNASPSDQRR